MNIQWILATRIIINNSWYHQLLHRIINIIRNYHCLFRPMLLSALSQTNRPTMVLFLLKSLVVSSDISPTCTQGSVFTDEGDGHREGNLPVPVCFYIYILITQTLISLAILIWRFSVLSCYHLQHVQERLFFWNSEPGKHTFCWYIVPQWLFLFY